MKTVTNPTTGEVVEYTDAQFNAERDRLIMAWEAQKKTLEVAKDAEMTLRKAVVAFTFDPEKTKGTENVDLGNGWKIKAVKKINYGWIKKDDKVDADAIETALDAIEATGNEGAFIAERLVSWSPTLSVSEYNKLDDKYKKLIDAVIVTTDGAPTLEVVAPKS
jgi:hypothetical protein